jgi:hypothetical protein
MWHSHAWKLQPLEERSVTRIQLQRRDSCVIITEWVVQRPLATKHQVHACANICKRRCAGLTEPRAQVFYSGLLIIVGFEVYPCSRSTEDDLSPEVANSSINRRCLPLHSGVFLEYHRQYLARSTSWVTSSDAGSIPVRNIICVRRIKTVVVESKDDG